MSRISAVFGVWLALFCHGLAQTQPTPQPLPYSQGFGISPFATLPAGMVAWNGLNGGSIDIEADAAASVPTGDAAVSTASTIQTTAGSYGLATGGNARFYIQTSSNPTNGANQLAIALDTTGQIDVTLQYDVEIISAQPRTVGVLCQYRIGTTGNWSSLTPFAGANPFSQSGGTSGVKTTPRISLPAAAANQPVVQIRWAVWRGNETGNSSGAAIDQISVAGNPSTNSLSVTAEPATIIENAGANASLITVTTTTPATVDLPVTLTVSDPGEAVVDGPNPAVIPAGESSASFNLRAVDDELIDGTQSLTLTASAPAAVPASTNLTVLDDEDANSPPPTYYASARGLGGTALKGALKSIISAGHVQYLYSATLNPLRAIYADPANSSNVLTVYSGASLAKNSVFYGSPADPNLTWSREHIWPVSFGLDPDGVNPGNGDGDAGADYTDLFNLRPAIHSVNTARGNFYYDESTGAVTIPALAPECSKDSNSWEPRDVEKGDLARSLLYMATRYDGTDPNTLDLEIGNAPSSTAGVFAKLSTLLQWHAEDPVSLEERRQNQLIFTSYQKNRNPFIDRPEYVGLIWGSLRVSKFEAAVTEGGLEDSYTLVLTGQPSANVTVSISSTPGSQVLATPSSITFTTANWNVPQTVILSAVNDAVYEATLTTTVEHSIASADSYYASLAPSSIRVTVTDNDPLISPTTLPIHHGGPWSPLPTGFLGTGLGTYSSSLGGDANPGSAQFNSTGDRLVISFNSPPATVSYWLRGNPASGETATAGTFLIQESVNGTDFTTIRTISNKDNADQSYSDTLSGNTRFVSFLYQTKTAGNLQLDKLAITGSSWLAWQSVHGLSGPEAAADFDIDKDGFVNLAEYALGGSPAGADLGIRPVLERQPTATRITAVIRIGDPALKAAAESTVDITLTDSWTSSGVRKISPVSQTGVAAGFERMVFEVDDGESPRRFIRLRFELD